MTEGAEGPRIVSKPFDATLKGLLELSPESWLALAGYSARRVEVIDADVSTFTGATDKALRVRGDHDWLIDFNFQSGPDASLPRRMHLYNALLGSRHGLPVRSVAVLLAPKAHLTGIAGSYEERFPGEQPYLDFRYQVVRVWELSPEPLLAGGLGTLPLAPISDVAESDLPDVIERMKQRIGGTGAPPGARDLWTATYVLMGLRYQRALMNRLLQGVKEMEESVTYQAIIEKGEAKGRREEARKNLLIIATKCFGDPPAEVTSAVEEINNLRRLERLIARVFDVKSWEELLDLPHKPKARRRRKSSS